MSRINVTLAGNIFTAKTFKVNENGSVKFTVCMSKEPKQGSDEEKKIFTYTAVATGETAERIRKLAAIGADGTGKSIRFGAITGTMVRMTRPEENGPDGKTYPARKGAGYPMIYVDSFELGSGSCFDFCAKYVMNGVHSVKKAAYAAEAEGDKEAVVLLPVLLNSWNPETKKEDIVSSYTMVFRGVQAKRIIALGKIDIASKELQQSVGFAAIEGDFARGKDKEGKPGMGDVLFNVNGFTPSFARKKDDAKGDAAPKAVPAEEDDAEIPF